ncbi:MAG: 50S ribosomal protein L17 [Verrucomicrobia bacterium CG_4_10_14_3_um_filter_43_23]|nr:MAG: 50S ribosomal protein L17 [Verrucomicrobia bacterium CG1_02_43_26]PIP59591.1 MAG: 50S ribosomal protein L17 [Verrucomicrobia bacterium CG22_combo_CG10-13_8_21_14_all_43_17]PIX58890.1 MAG: 50S ribosomal protein L17 [Verrucomicrobia bacterium CG_4_10_14_3_um_filter_43_23]PIY61666.1 MAG: 50S ribosomal protein L17 [Verrucomicrobia bacterium CG_4_10_14_0_8_um_filter_43_34]PJA44550.1 MAG: 50S ribosomal protein L17 [Verrucomicrobia bacterium CG_4_9_14_3_um_filter_43_20]
MRHGNHRHQLGVKKAHRSAMLASLAGALITHGRIKTTLAKAKALRPFIEKIVTMSVKASKAEDLAQKLHFRRLAISRVRDKVAIKRLFDERAEEFLNRPGGYTRIYKLIARRGDSADMALIEFIEASDEGYTKGRKKKVSAKRKVVQHAKTEKEEAKSESTAE